MSRKKLNFSVLSQVLAAQSRLVTTDTSATKAAAGCRLHSGLEKLVSCGDACYNSVDTVHINGITGEHGWHIICEQNMF